MRTVYSPFLTIPAIWRFVIILYFVLYEWLFPVLLAINSTAAETLLLPRIIVRLFFVLLICWPLIFYRHEFGFLHPVILPTLFVTLKGIAKYPLALALPFDFPVFSFNVPSASSAFSITHLSIDDLAWTRLWHEAVLVIALCSYYLGYFFIPLFRVPRVAFHPPRHLVPVCLTATILCVLVGVFFIQVYGGGLIEHLIAMRSGRSSVFEGLGQFLVIAEFAVVPVLVWFLYAKRPLLDPRWLFSLLAAAMVSMLTSGSRSAFVYPLIVLMFLWWQKSERVLIIPSFALACVAILIFGVFGAIRQGESSTIDTSIFNPAGVTTVIQNAQNEFGERNNEESSFAAFAGTRNTMLWGRTYLASLTFFVPRALWPDKPRSADAYNMWVNFSGNDLDTFGSGRIWGIPVGPAEEAYWNFMLPGVIAVFLLLGSFHRWLSNWVWRNLNTRAVLLLSVWISINFTGTSISLTGVIRDVLLILALYWSLGILGRCRRRVGCIDMPKKSPIRSAVTTSERT